MCDTKLTKGINSWNRSIRCLSFLVFMAGCKVPAYQFSSSSVVTRSFINSVPALCGVKGTDSVIGIRSFRAVITEKLVNNHNVAEYMLMNENSTKTTIDIAASRYRNELYFFECRFEEELYGILLSATFLDDKNIGAGPMYIGLIGEDGTQRKFLATHINTMKMSQTRLPVIRTDRLASELRFFYTKHSTATGVESINITQVLELKRSKLSGTLKLSIFDIAQIFNDPRALQFNRYHDQ